ncbi:DHH family phosphoesterase [Halocatena halophila]|uniref:DHH family phosphoesterase n=1 Tax=Halocatena halophila TaxID=2814576 RepID=UPI002ED396DD
MDESLIDADSLGLERKSVLPGTGFFTPDDDDDELSPERVAALEAASAVVIADSDADGLGCAALIRTQYDDPIPDEISPEMDTEELPDHEVALIPGAPHSLTESQEQIIEHAPADVAVYICDLAPDRDSDIEPLEELVEHASQVSWFDHHQWDPSYVTQVEAAGVNLVLGESDEECSTDVTLRSLETSFEPSFAELAALTRDHDLWLKEDSRSDDLADFANWTPPELYVATVRRHGVSFPDAVAEYITERRIEKERLIDKAIERAELHELSVGTGTVTVGVTYGRCSQNEVAEGLREQGADAAVVVKPSGPVSLRGTDNFERCHEVAATLGGGGHPKAAGCKPDIYDDMLDYAHHWTTRGAIAKRLALSAFRELEASEE